MESIKGGGIVKCSDRSGSYFRCLVKIALEIERQNKEQIKDFRSFDTYLF